MNIFRFFFKEKLSIPINSWKQFFLHWRRKVFLWVLGLEKNLVNGRVVGIGKFFYYKLIMVVKCWIWSLHGLFDRILFWGSNWYQYFLLASRFENVRAALGWKSEANNPSVFRSTIKNELIYYKFLLNNKFVLYYNIYL